MLITLQAYKSKLTSQTCLKIVYFLKSCKFYIFSQHIFLGHYLKYKKVIIIGGGLAGLYAAYLLEQQHIPFVLLEAQSRLGGRILGAQNKSNTDHHFDLGPAWIFPHQKKIQRLTTQLGISLFEQYSTGDVLYQTSLHQTPKRIEDPGGLQLFKIKGGSQTLLSALQNTVDQNKIQLNHALTHIERQSNLWHLSVSHNGVEQYFSADELMLAMPPRIIAPYLANKQWISGMLLNSLQKSQTWMAGQAKFVVTYTTPFWRERGLSGQIFSQTGPMVEVHDASTDIHQSHGLFGFIGWPASRRSQMTEQQLKEACLAQLVNCYGSDANNFIECYYKDWAVDQFTCTADDRLESSQHPEFSISNHQQELSKLHLHFIGSEFAKLDPGYLEGALDAVDTSVSQLCG
jgi:monoamine oxidase